MRKKLTLTEPRVAEKATTPAQSAAVANFREPMVVIPEFFGSGTAASVNRTAAANTSAVHTTLKHFKLGLKSKK